MDNAGQILDKLTPRAEAISAFADTIKRVEGVVAQWLSLTDGHLPVGDNPVGHAVAGRFASMGSRFFTSLRDHYGKFTADDAALRACRAGTYAVDDATAGAAPEDAAEVSDVASQIEDAISSSGYADTATRPSTAMPDADGRRWLIGTPADEAVLCRRLDEMVAGVTGRAG